MLVDPHNWIETLAREQHGSITAFATEHDVLGGIENLSRHDARRLLRPLWRSE